MQKHAELYVNFTTRSMLTTALFNAPGREIENMLAEISEMYKEMKAAGKILTPWKTLVIEALLLLM